MMTTRDVLIEVLTEARSYIEKGWTQRSFARDEYGKPVDGRDPEACEWCAMGAIWKVVGYSGTEAYQEARDLIYSLVDFVDFNTVSQFNDHADTTQADVLALFDKAIKGIDK